MTGSGHEGTSPVLRACQVHTVYNMYMTLIHMMQYTSDYHSQCQKHIQSAFAAEGVTALEQLVCIAA